MISYIANTENNGIIQKGVIVRHLLLPGLLFDSKKVIDLKYVDPFKVEFEEVINTVDYFVNSISRLHYLSLI